MRFFTVPSAKEAGKSVFIATGFIGDFRHRDTDPGPCRDRLGVFFEHVNVAFLVGVVAAVAASVNFPVPVSPMFWR